VGSNSYQAAAGYYAQCTDPTAKKSCNAKMAQTARKQVQFAANNGQCPQARLIADAAQRMDVPAGAFAKALASCPK